MDTNKLFAFVLMPFDSSFNDTYQMGIKETASSLNIKAERVDEQIFQEGILERIYRQIDISDIIIADMTGQNPNVFYEVGYAHAKEKICILLTHNADDIPFDLKHHRHIVYGSSIDTLRKNLKKELTWAKKEIEDIRASHIQVDLKKSTGFLKLSEYSAEGSIDFEINLRNNSKKPSAEIDAIYFYSTKDWSLVQDGKKCPSTESDIDNYTISHFITPPVRKLQKNSWAQVKFKTEKVLAHAYKGDELKKSYHVHGTAILRLITSAGNFDYDIVIDTICDEIPF